jgi:hypothetical protein
MSTHNLSSTSTKQELSSMDKWIDENLGRHVLLQILSKYDQCRLKSKNPLYGEYASLMIYRHDFRRCGMCCHFRNEKCFFTGKDERV